MNLGSNTSNSIELESTNDSSSNDTNGTTSTSIEIGAVSHTVVTTVNDDTEITATVANVASSINDAQTVSSQSHASKNRRKSAPRAKKDHEDARNK